MFPQTDPEIPKKTPNTLLGLKKEEEEEAYLLIHPALTLSQKGRNKD